MSTSKLTTLLKGFEKKLVTSIKSLNAGRQAVHEMACAAMYHAAEHGDPIHLNQLMDALDTENDKNSLRIWTGRIEDVMSWLAYSKEDGFKVKKGTEKIRKGTIDDTILSKPSFFVKNAKQPNAWEIAKEYERLETMAKRIKSKAAKGEDVDGADIIFFEDVARKARLHRMKAEVAAIEAEANGSTEKEAPAQSDDTPANVAVA